MPVVQSTPVTFSFTIESALAIDPIVAPNAVVGQPYPPLDLSQFVHGGVGPYVWTVQTGASLPNGMSLSLAGVFSGTPTAAGTSNIALTVHDSGT